MLWVFFVNNFCWQWELEQQKLRKSIRLYRVGKEMASHSHIFLSCPRQQIVYWTWDWRSPSTFTTVYIKTRWWFETFVIFTPIPGEMIEFDGRIFFRWVGSTTNQIKIWKETASLWDVRGSCLEGWWSEKVLGAEDMKCSRVVWAEIYQAPSNLLDLGDCTSQFIIKL